MNQQERREARGAAATLNDAANGPTLRHRGEAREVREQGNGAVVGRERVLRVFLCCQGDSVNDSAYLLGQMGELVVPRGRFVTGGRRSERLRC